MVQKRRRAGAAIRSPSMGQLDIGADPELAEKSIAARQVLAEELFFLPVGRWQMLGAGEHLARALRALAHAAAIAQMRKRILLDACADDKIAVVLHLAFVALPEFVEDDLRHDRAPSDQAAIRSPAPVVAAAPSVGST